MNTEKLNTQELTFQATELDIQIDLLSTKKAVMELKVTECSKELESLRAKQHEIIHDLHQLEAPSYYMWENIGDGG
jgi:phage shock protein A